MSLPTLDPGDFAEFFTAVYGYEPFPWQERLARDVAGGSAWPTILDLPTGCGKTAALDIAVFHLALQAGETNRQAALRIVYVVDRRTIVDQAYQRAKKLATSIAEARKGVLASVRARLASYSREATLRGGQALQATLLRGGIARNEDWARSPDQPVIAVSTVDQVGSRLLFRGYGISDTMKPIHAGLLGNDVLYLLDEVHLSQPFRETLASIANRFRTWAETPVPSPFHVVEMSATPGKPVPSAFRLQDEDQAHPILSQRLTSSKWTALVETNARGFSAQVEKAVEPLVERPGATVAVVVNRVAAAREVHARLARSLDGVDVELMTGRMRPFDRQDLEERLLERVRAGRVRDRDQKPLVVVATQCIEAGADFDFDALVTECASLDALRQRFGRLDRLGELRGESKGVIIGRTDTFKDDPIYGSSLGSTWNWLREQAEASETGLLDMGLAGLKIPDDASERGLLTPPASAPILLPQHLDAWVQTFPRPTPDPDVSLWLHGPDRGTPDVQLVWRADLTEELLRAAREATTSEAALDCVLSMVESLPPCTAEAMSVPLPAVKRWLARADEVDVFDVEGSTVDSEDGDRRSERTSARRYAVAWRGEESRVVDASEIKPGDTLVVPVTYGGIAGGTWSPSSLDAVSDVGEISCMYQRGRAVLRLHQAVLAGLCGAVPVSAPTPAPLDDEEIDDRAVVEQWLAEVAELPLPNQTQDLLARLRDDPRGFRVERLAAGDGSREYLVVSGRSRFTFGTDEVSTEDDRASFTGVKVSLAEHLEGVRDLSGEFAERVGLPPKIASDVQLAGRWHDVGKIDPRFQCLLHGGSEFKALTAKEPLAKSATVMTDRRARRRTQERSGYPAGTRHELMSVQLMSGVEKSLAGRANDWDLVLHLVASHHGRCRPLAPWTPDEKPVEMKWNLDDVELTASSVHELHRLDSGIPERFWRLVRRYGWWGLAWLEAVLRLGDHRRSEEEQKGLARG